MICIKINPAPLEAASRAMARLREEHYTPVPENKAIYDKLFTEYVSLHDYFGRGANDVMKRLKELKAEIRLERIGG